MQADAFVGLNILLHISVYPTSARPLLTSAFGCVFVRSSILKQRFEAV